MKIEVKRTKFGPKATIGDMYIDGVRLYYTLEDVVRPKGEKVQNETAIPSGTYKVSLDFSNRFAKVMPHILDVPGFDGIRIHSGNSDLDTDGCILLGLEYINDDFIGRSKDAFNDFMPRLEAGLKQGPVEITIS